MKLQDTAVRVISDLSPRVPTLGPPLPVIIPVEWPERMQQALTDSPLYPLSRAVLTGELKLRDIIQGKKG